MKTAELFENRTVFSLEVFPPKPDADESVIYDTLNGLSDICPDFISVTYGASGGNNCSKTIQIASDIKHRYGVESVAHLPCIGLKKEEAAEILNSLQAHGIENVLALRGDRRDENAPKGVDGIHLYTMNNSYIAHRIYEAVESLISVNSYAAF